MERVRAIIDIGRRIYDDNSSLFTYVTQYSSVKIQVLVSRYNQFNNEIHTYIHSVKDANSFDIVRILDDTVDTDLAVPINNIECVCVFFKNGIFQPMLAKIVPIDSKDKHIYVARDVNNYWVAYHTKSGTDISDVSKILLSCIEHNGKLRLDELEGLDDPLYAIESKTSSSTQINLKLTTEIKPKDDTVIPINDTSQSGNQTLVRLEPNHTGIIICGIINGLICITILSVAIYLMFIRLKRNV